MLKGFFAGSLVAIFSVLTYLYIHLGFRERVSIKEEARGPFYVIYQDHLGAYYRISAVIDTVEKAVKEAKLPCERTFGEFFDNPKTVDEDRLHSRGGCISMQPYMNLPPGFLSAEIPARSYVIASFSGSPAIGPWKVYPEVQEYRKNHGLPDFSESIEIYSLHGNGITTEYLIPR